jgi:triacylglycerol lipase
MVFPEKIEGYDHRVALNLARLSQWAYPFGVAVSIDYKTHEDFTEDMERKRKKAAAWGFRNFQYVFSEDKRILALIFRKRRDLVICFRGTVLDNTINLQADIQARFVPMESFGLVHKGFNSLLDSVWEKIKTHIQPGERQRIWLTGHSMGGALALLAGARFVSEYKRQPNFVIDGIYVFGAPRVGDQDFADAFNSTYLRQRSFLFAKYNDIVTVLPPCIKRIWEYKDVGNIIYIDQEGTLKSIECLSEMKTLRSFLSGYFSENLLGGLNKEKMSHDWQAFKWYFTRFFSELKLVVSTPREESEHWSRFKIFFTKELPALEPNSNHQSLEKQHSQEVKNKKGKHNENTSKGNSYSEHRGQRRLLRMLSDLFVELFVEINPYVIESHDIESYIDNLENWAKQKKNISFVIENCPSL